MLPVPMSPSGRRASECPFWNLVRATSGRSAISKKMIADELDRLGIALVCLAGYMRIVGDELLGRYAGRIINIHPALLPAFPGAHAIRDAFEYGVKVYGVTIHRVDSTVDGGAIIAQEAVPYEGRDIDELTALIHSAEHRLYPAAIARLLAE